MSTFLDVQRSEIMGSWCCFFARRRRPDHGRFPAQIVGAEGRGGRYGLSPSRIDPVRRRDEI
jgi:hypothetical protein